ncbi:uncharacterized protein LOC105184001 [Harpegnathos saltator]|uniref:uncharacterized protein LOC105184001 n=1 Tax=Harpegnathos saltator TaxID=610380 RepID=UPI000DBEF07C|nr:uncharacterized protein LOC105184001 [Harpegnathos saltator]
MSNTGGRRSHDYYIEGEFIRVRENGKYFAICKLCNTRLCTTAVKHLKTHRWKTGIQYSVYQLRLTFRSIPTKRHDPTTVQLATVHSSEFLTKHGIVQLRQPPYSPDIAPCDFWLKHPLKGKRFDDVEEINARRKLLTIRKNDF